MRKIIPFLLLASAVPAMASAQDQGGWRHSSQSDQSNDNQSQRAERAERSEARQQVREEARAQFQAQRQAQDSSQGNAGAFAAMRERFQAQQQAQQQQGDSNRAERMQRYQQLRAQQQQQGESSRVERMQRFQQMQAQQQQQGEVNREERMQRFQQIQAQQLQQNDALRAERMRRYQQGQSGIATGQRGFRSFTGTNQQIVPAPTRDGVRYDRNNTTRWTNNWRDDRRYDWRDYRRHHHSTFHIGFYFDPFGYGYQRYGIGSFLYPSYYQSSFWINDPWQYRLPPVYGPYRWVRYHDDALLIDIWSGEVVDVIYDFFW